MATKANTVMASVRAGANNCSKTEVSMMANGETIWLMAEGSSLTATVAIMKENSSIIVVMARADQSNPTATFMMVTGKEIYNMDKDNKGGNPVVPTKAAIDGERKTAMERTSGQTRVGIRAIGPTI